MRNHHLFRHLSYTNTYIDENFSTKHGIVCYSLYVFDFFVEKNVLLLAEGRLLLLIAVFSGLCLLKYRGIF